MNEPETQKLGYMQLPKWRDTTWTTRILALVLLAPIVYIFTLATYGDGAFIRGFFIAVILWIFLVSLIHKLTKPYLFKE